MALGRPVNASEPCWRLGGGLLWSAPAEAQTATVLVSNTGQTVSGSRTPTVVLPVTIDCNADGAVCTGDGRKLSNRLELTVSGPGQ